MSETLIARPVLVILLVVLLIGDGLFGLGRGVFNVLESQTLVMWPLLAASLLNMFISSGLEILAGLMVFAGRRAGWSLAGVVLCATLIGGLFGSLQLWFIEVNNEQLYIHNPWLLYWNLLGSVVSMGLLFVLFSRSVRAWLDVEVVSIPRHLAGFFGLGLLLMLAMGAIMILAAWLNSLMMA